MSNSGQYRSIVTIVGANYRYYDHSVWISATGRSHHFHITQFHVTTTKPICIEEMLLQKMKAKSRKKEKKPIEQEVERYLVNLMDDDGALKQIVEEEIRRRWQRRRRK
jgi:hypothetical protein